MVVSRRGEPCVYLVFYLEISLGTKLNNCIKLYVMKVHPATTNKVVKKNLLVVVFYGYLIKFYNN